MSVFATSHWRLAFLIFRISTGFSVPALAIRQRVFVRTNKQYASLTSKVPCPEPRGGDATAVQSRWQIPQRASSEGGSAQEPHCAKGCAPPQFIRGPRGNRD